MAEIQRVVHAPSINNCREITSIWPSCGLKTWRVTRRKMLQTSQFMELFRGAIASVGRLSGFAKPFFCSPCKLRWLSRIWLITGHVGQSCGEFFGIGCAI